MSTFKIPEMAVPVMVKKPPVKVSPSQPEQQKSLQSMKSALPATMPGGPDSQATQALPDRSWNMNQSGPAQITASDLLAGDREIWAKGVILAMILGKPRCKSKGWR